MLTHLFEKYVHRSCWSSLWTSVLMQTDNTPNLLAKEELNLLARLMGSMKAENAPKVETGFRINLFPSDQEEEEEEAWVPSFNHFIHSKPELSLSYTSVTSGLVDRGASGGAQESSLAVVNIQAMQVQSGAADWWIM